MYGITFKLLDTGYAPASGSGSSVAQQARDFISRALDTVAAWHERARQRRHLMELDDRLLQDIGLTRADVARETGKSFWEA
ncbi:MAG: DUF1127 domain-containing protein [Acidiferrobacterales bacterium]